MLINLFPTTIYRAEMPEYVNWVKSQFKNHRFTEGLTGELEGKVLVHQDTHLASFFVEVNEHVRNFLDDMNCNYDAHFMKTWYAWSTEVKPVPNHHHAPAHMSWTYYLEGTDPLVFTQDSKNEWFPEAFAHVEKNFFNSTAWQENVEPGTLLIFPSHLHHHTYNTGNRGCLAGDILLTNNNLNTEGGLIHPQYWKQF